MSIITVVCMPTELVFRDYLGGTVASHWNDDCYLRTCSPASQSELLALFHFRGEEMLNPVSKDTPQISAGNGCRDPYLARDAVKQPHMSLVFLS